MYMERSLCTLRGCKAAASRSPGAGCDMCQNHLCSAHMLPEHHECSLTAEEIARLRAKINEEAVCKLASQLNDHKPCTIEFPSVATSGPSAGTGVLMGCANYHARIRFRDDPRSWLMRIPRVTGYACDLPVSSADYFVRSEYATLKFLNTTTVPVPQVFTFGTTTGVNSNVGVSFLLMEELPGRPWDGESHQAKIWKRLAEAYADLAQHPFPLAGSLIVDTPGDESRVGAFASDRFDRIDPYGPFETSLAYYVAWTEQYLDLIANGQLYHQFPVEAYLVYRFLQDQAPGLSEPQQDGRFFLKHVDDQGDHILVDDDGNMTGIIDWSMARVVPQKEAFALSFVSANMSELCSENALLRLSDKDKAFREVLVDQGLEEQIGGPDERIRRFFWGLALETEWQFALAQAEGILRAFRVEQGWHDWKKEAIESWKGEERLAKLVRDDKNAI